MNTTCFGRLANFIPISHLIVQPYRLRSYEFDWKWECKRQSLIYLLLHLCKYLHPGSRTDLFRNKFYTRHIAWWIDIIHNVEATFCDRNILTVQIKRKTEWTHSWDFLQMFLYLFTMLKIEIALIFSYE